MEHRNPQTTPLLWDRLQRPPRGPRPALTHRQIAEAAIRLADAEGLQAVSMRRVAARLESGTMSLYRYLATKEDLLDLMLDQVLGEDLPQAPPSGDWRRELTELARRQRRLALRHPWALGLVLDRPKLGPNALDLVEYSLGCLEGLGLDIDTMLDLTNVVSGFAVTAAQAELAEQEARRRSGLGDVEWRTRMAPYVQRVLATGRYPLLERVVRDAEDFPDDEAVFERRLQLVVDGVALRIADAQPAR